MLTRTPNISGDSAGTTETRLPDELVDDCSAKRGRFSAKSTTPTATTEPPAM
jgi:hypothetical protein